MDYEIVNLYTESLNLSSFKNSFDEDNIKSLAKCDVSLIPENDNMYTFLIEFILRAVNNPLTLQWIGVGILKYEGDEKLTEDILLNDEIIRNFIDDSLDRISFLLGCKLPDFVDMRKK